MTLDYTPELIDGKAVYISESGSIIEPDGYMNYHGHKDFSAANILVDYFSYRILDSKEFNSLNGNNKKKLLHDLKELQESLKYGPKDGIEKIKLDLVEFLINCYRGSRFDLSLGRTLTIISSKEFKSTGEERKIEGTEEEKYREYINRCITAQFKDIMISYLGYDATEVKLPNTITTSSLKINERFYNYLLMDYKIVKMPRFIYDPKKRKYVMSKDEFFLREKEDILYEEIKTLKIDFPHKEDRIQFFK